MVSIPLSLLLALLGFPPLPLPGSIELGLEIQTQEADVAIFGVVCNSAKDVVGILNYGSTYPGEDINLVLSSFNAEGRGICVFIPEEEAIFISQLQKVDHFTADDGTRIDVMEALSEHTPVYFATLDETI